ncbi:hypothetical protein GCM10011519_20250 [Marmoricola endophyticus]|uniref:Cytosolic protein n=1 Tax=Marmoricola endophyticus TaxID=2040280 RepID=A0A917BIJ6_9ACTN|nr:DUF6282 family protein [Marmoricola endophyticus]GGF46256.1 hypothetical protein GCM10011519_20250 [Marmoricola endophyticus]
MTDAQHPRPSERARELVRGGFDVHVHVAPDVMERRIADSDLAHTFAEAGLGGFVLKSHYVPTTERAAVVNTLGGARAVGAVTLNAAVGGMNPIAVEIAARGGAGFVWMPTVDSANQRACLASDPEGAKPPMWAQLQDDLRRAGMAADPVPVLDADGTLLPRTRQVLQVIATHDLVLATGHLHGDEISAVVEAAVATGVRRIVVTHPEFTSQRLDSEKQQELAAQGALLERCYTTPLTGKVGWETWFRHIREAGPESSVVSSDLGQPFNPPVEDGLGLAADRLLEHGFSDDEVRTMTVTNTRALVGADPLP